MTLNEFKDAIESNEEPADMHVLLKALWCDAQGQWERAHDLSQTDNSSDSAWMHAYLHRKEGDIGNASYWYHQAGRQAANCSLEDEWGQISTDFLKRLS